MSKLTEPGANVAKVIEEVPETKAAKKITDTIIGFGWIVLGVLSCFVTFALMWRVVSTDGTLDMWSTVFTAAPLVAGIFFCVLGGLIASGELVRAGLKDVGNLLAIWRRK
jgi:CDP-diglyceride synthetase